MWGLENGKHALCCLKVPHADIFQVLVSRGQAGFRLFQQDKLQELLTRVG